MQQVIHTHTFDNGLVLLAESLEGVESAAFALRVAAGTAYEADTASGLGNLACELALRGSGPRDNRQFVTELDNLGVVHDAGVSSAHTTFSGATLSKHLHRALGIFFDVVRRPHLPAGELESARAVSLQEVAAVEDEPSQKVMQELRKRFLPQPWGRPSQGEEAGVRGATLEQVQQFIARFYRPHGAVVAVAGRFDWDELRREVERHSRDWQGAKIDEPAPGKVGPRLAHLHHESNQTQIGIAYSSVANRDPEFFQAWGAVGVLSGGMSARLFTEVREKRGLCYSVYATHYSLRESGGVLCYAGTTAARAQETLDVTVGELVRLAQGVQPNELDRLKARIKSALVMQQESTSARASSIARDWYYLGRVRPLDEIEAAVDGLSCDSINRHLAQHKPRDFTIVTLGPQPLEVPSGVS